MQLISLNEIQSSTTQWIWEPYIPLGKITIVQGDPGEGKTSLMLMLSTLLSRGLLPHETEKTFEPFEVLYLNAEDDYSDTIKPRLEAAGADCSHIHALFEDIHDDMLTLDDHRIEGAIRGLNARLLVIDPIQAYLGSKVDMHRANEIRPVMKRLAEIAANTNCAVVLIGHMNKAQGMKSTYRGLGSIDITAAARSVIVVAKDKSNPDIRVVAQIKNSLAPMGETLGFKFCENGVFKSIGPYNCDIDDVLLGIGTKQKCTAVEEMLKDELADGGKPQTELVVKAGEMGISVNTLRKAKDKLGVKAEKKGNIWYWTLS